jgi:hypothetical protein
MDYDSCPPLYNAYEAKKLLDGLHSKLVKKKTKMVYFPGRLAHTLTLFRGDQPTHSQWSIFRGDLPTQTHTGLFSWATCPHTLTLVVVYFHGLLTQAYSKWSIFRGDQPTHSQLPWSIFMGDLPK